MELLPAVLTGSFGILGLLVGQWLGRSRARADRLRALYADVLNAAIRATPLSFGYRVGPEDMPLDAHEMNMLRARLGVETEEDEDTVLGELVGVYNWSSMYRGTLEQQKANPDSVPPDELRRLEQLVRTSIDDLQAAIRSRVADAERPWPWFGSLWRKTTARTIRPPKMAAPGNEVLLAELHELGADMREEASYRFRILALLLTAYGGAAAALIQQNISTSARGPIALAAAAVGGYLYLAEFRAAEHWYAFERRVKVIHQQLGMRQWEDHIVPTIQLPLIGRLNSTWWTRAFMLIALGIWVGIAVTQFIAYAG